jgi:predicted unusual protein kinase regulating ubiquinone biosynthesis (AarF/ABC1/UbiB family)
VYDAYCTASILTLENVAYIRIADTQSAEAAGIDRSQVADRLYDIYMHQIFVTSFVHVDPHPGNLFIKPLPVESEIQAGIEGFAPGETVPSVEQRPFQLVFIDFGMTAVVSERLKAAMRAGAMGLGTQDAQKIIQAYVMAGSLRPGADLRRLEQAHQEWLQKIWGLRLGALQEAARREVAYFMREYRDLIRDTPFQFQADMLFIARAVGILAGLTTAIDPQFDPWTKALVYAKRFAREELTEDWQGFWEELFMLGKHAWRIPSHLDQVLTRTKQGALTVQVSLSPEMRRAIHRIDLSVKRFAWMVITAGLLVAAVNLHIAGKDTPFGITLLFLSIAAFLWGMRRG